jgi:hypothetical protein
MKKAMTMTDLTQKLPGFPSQRKRLDKPVLVILAIPVLLAILDPAQVWPTLERVALNRFQSWLWLAAHNATTVMHVATRM